jgi:hypothetical protein
VNDAEKRGTSDDSRLRRVLAESGTDAAVALVWAALVVAIVLFSGVVSQFLYVDF